MSQENVELVADAYEALRRGGVDAFSEYWAEDIEWRTMRSQWFGRDAGRAYLNELVDLFDAFTTEPLELIDAGGDRVVVYLRYGGRSRRGGVDIPPEYFAIVIRVRDGKIAQAVEYATKQEALAAAGPPNLDALARTAFGALNSRDLDGLLAVAAEDVEFTSMVAEVEGTTFRGHDGVRAWWQTVLEAFGDVRWDVIEVRDRGERGVARVRMDGTLGGVPLNLGMWLAARQRDGKVTWWSWYRTEEEALAAVGLPD